MTSPPLDYVELREIAEKATPHRLETAENVESLDDYDCPMCGGDGFVPGKTWTNFDDAPVGIQVFGIGSALLANEAYVNAFTPAVCLALLADNARMREVVEEREVARSQPGSDAQERSPDQPHSDGWRDIALYDGCHPVLVGREPDKYLWGPFAAFKDVTGVWRIHGGDGCTPLHFEPTLFMNLPKSPQAECAA